MPEGRSTGLAVANAYGGERHFAQFFRNAEIIGSLGVDQAAG